VAKRPQLPEHDYETMPAEEILRTFLDAFPGRVSLACSFQKEEAVLLDMLYAIDPDARVFALDTHVLFPETYAVWREVERRYDTKVEIYQGPTLARQAELHGEALWERKPDLCCAIRKVEPLARALGGLDAWITGLRRDQSPTRANAPKAGWDETHELWKANPLADWDDERCWAYIRERNLPYNQLHDRGYSSIGCTHCTKPGEGREGRWEGVGKTECGLHVVANSPADADELASRSGQK
jgi:phosphoadenosine phosphosulfate reductase